MAERENDRPYAEIEMLLLRTLGAIMPDRIVEWLGVGRRNAERWLGGQSTFPPPVLERLDQQAPLADELLERMDHLVRDLKSRGMHENLIRIRLREYAKGLSDAYPPKPPPRRRADEE